MLLPRRFQHSGDQSFLPALHAGKTESKVGAGKWAGQHIYWPLIGQKISLKKNPDRDISAAAFSEGKGGRLLVRLTAPPPSDLQVGSSFRRAPSPQAPPTPKVLCLPPICLWQRGPYPRPPANHKVAVPPAPPSLQVMGPRALATAATPVVAPLIRKNVDYAK